MDYDKKSIIDKACTDTINKYGSEQCVFAILSFITKKDENKKPFSNAFTGMENKLNMSENITKEELQNMIISTLLVSKEYRLAHHHATILGVQTTDIDKMHPQEVENYLMDKYANTSDVNYFCNQLKNDMMYGYDDMFARKLVSSFVYDRYTNGLISSYDLDNFEATNQSAAEISASIMNSYSGYKSK